MDDLSKSTPLRTFERNLKHISELFDSQKCFYLPDVASDFHKVSERLQARIHKLTAELQSSDSAAAQDEFSRGAISDLEETKQHFQVWFDALSFVRGWMQVMLVTFVEVYVEQVFDLLLDAGLEECSLPSVIRHSMKRKYIKEVLRGTPGEWIRRLEIFGARGYRANLGEDMKALWEKRHATVHSAEPSDPLLAINHFSKALEIVGSFIDATEFSVVSVERARRSKSSTGTLP
ncbi:MAG: hypothetical protein ACR2I2_01640 [Bryobacteraceae bacterium]